MLSRRQRSANQTPTTRICGFCFLVSGFVSSAPLREGSQGGGQPGFEVRQATSRDYSVMPMTARHQAFS